MCQCRFEPNPSPNPETEFYWPIFPNIQFLLVVDSYFTSPKRRPLSCGFLYLNNVFTPTNKSSLQIVVILTRILGIFDRSIGHYVRIPPEQQIGLNPAVHLSNALQPTVGSMAVIIDFYFLFCDHIFFWLAESKVMICNLEEGSNQML